MERKHVSSGASIGFATGMIAWACCVSSIVLGFLGLSAAAGFMAEFQEKYHWYLVGLAFIFMDGAIYYFLKHYHGACNIQVIRRNYAQVLFIVLAAVAFYFIFQEIVGPLSTLAHVPAGAMAM